MNLTAPSRCPNARWIVVVLAAICAGLHIWDLPAAIPSVRHDLTMTLVQWMRKKTNHCLAWL